METRRTSDLLSYLVKKKQATPKELCTHLHCSISTLRRELLELEKRKLIRRTWGGAILNETTNMEYTYLQREASNIPEKKIISELARDFIAPGMCIFLDSSSTVLHLIPLLVKIPNLIIITNGLRTALKLSECQNESLKIYLTGGEVKLNASTVISNTLDPITSSFRFNAAFLSCRGLDHEGIYEANFNQAQIKKEMMNKAQEIVLLADETKFDSTHFFKIGDYYDYDAIVTNKKPPKIYHRIIEKNDIHLVYPTE